MYIACMGMMLFVERLEGKLEKKEYPTEEELVKCNEILKLLQQRYGFNITWRGDIKFESAQSDLARRTAVTRFNHQVGSNPTALTIDTK